jgi:hypothetical protein
MRAIVCREISFVLAKDITDLSVDWVKNLVAYMERSNKQTPSRRSVMSRALIDEVGWKLRK